MFLSAAQVVFVRRVFALVVAGEPDTQASLRLGKLHKVLQPAPFHREKKKKSTQTVLSNLLFIIPLTL